MSNAAIAFRTIDYFKYKSLIIDGETNFLYRCNRELRTFYESTKALKSRSTHFECGDAVMLMKICSLYKIMLGFKKIASIDLKLKSGWWGEGNKTMDAGKLKTNDLKEVLMGKNRTWNKFGNNFKDIGIPGIYVFLHKTVHCFKIVCSSNSVLESVENILNSSFDGQESGSLTALLVTSLASSWHFYVLPIDNKNPSNWLQNDIILLHDAVWPKGLNVLLEVKNNEDFLKLRQSCCRYQWPPYDNNMNETTNIDIQNLLEEFQSQLLIPQWMKINNFQATTLCGLSSEEIKLSSNCLVDNKRRDINDDVENVDDDSSIISSITTTTIRTALESNELERNRQDLIVKLNRIPSTEYPLKNLKRSTPSSEQRLQKLRSISCNK